MAGFRASLFAACVAMAGCEVGVVPGGTAGADMSSVTTNANCTQTQPNMFDCDLQTVDALGGAGEQVLVPASVVNVRFTNNTGSYLQINSVSAETGEQSHWSEFSVYRNDFFTDQQGEPGIGEVGSIAKNPGEDYPPLRWDGYTTALSVAPGDRITIGSHTEPTFVDHTYTIYAYPQSAGVMSWRAPRIDQVNTCSGNLDSTLWNPWQNTTGQTLHLSGATTYAVSPIPNQVTAATLYVLRADGSIKFSYSDGVNERGVVTFAPQDVEPDEYIAGQAVNQCSSGLWGWVAFMYVW